MFAIISNLGAEWTGWPALLLTPLLAVPFFVLAWTSGRWPRLTGGLLLVATGAFYYTFVGFSPDRMPDGVALVFLIGPLLASRIALLVTQPEIATATPG